jgi:quinol monooxygenase YgiN
MSESAPRSAPQDFDLPGPLMVVVRVRVEAGRQDDFDLFIMGFAADVQRQEPGCLWYAAHRVLGSELDYIIVMRFRTWADYEAHGDSAHMKAALPKMDYFFDGPPTFEVYAAVM